jgi:SusE outer membrane protein
MKNIIKIFSFLFCMVFLASCEKDEEKLIYTTGSETPPTLALSTTNVVVNPATPNDNVVDFKVSVPANYGVPLGVSYELQMALKSSNFTTDVVTVPLTSLTKTYTHADMRKLLVINFDTDVELQARLLAKNPSPKVKQLISNVVDFKAKVQ